MELINKLAIRMFFPHHLLINESVYSSDAHGHLLLLLFQHLWSLGTEWNAMSDEFKCVKQFNNVKVSLFPLSCVCVWCSSGSRPLWRRARSPGSCIMWTRAAAVMKTLMVLVSLCTLDSLSWMATITWRMIPAWVKTWIQNGGQKTL